MKQRPGFRLSNKEKQQELKTKRYAYAVMYNRLSMYMSSQDYGNRRDILREILGLKSPIVNENNTDNFRILTNTKRPFDYTSDFLVKNKTNLCSHIHKLFEHVFFLFGYTGNMMIAQDILYSDAFVVPDFTRITTEQIAIQILSNPDAFLRLSTITELEIDSFEIEYNKIKTIESVYFVGLKKLYNKIKKVKIKPTRIQRPGITSDELESIIELHVPGAQTKQARKKLNDGHLDEEVDFTYRNIANMNTNGRLSEYEMKKLATKYKVFMKRYKDNFQIDIKSFLDTHFCLKDS